MIRQILWDWNGTLLDDLQYAIDVRNRSFPAFGLSPLSSVQEYHRQFTFPVREYYRRAGVTDEQFDTVAHAWMDEYMAGSPSIPLHSDALSTLERFRAAGLRQVILSASHLELLKQQLTCYPLANCFDELLGLSDIYAGSKAAIGQQYLARCGIAPEATVMLGDTLHDAEVAKTLGCGCILIPRGHQNREMLLTAAVPMADSLTQAADRILAALDA